LNTYDYSSSSDEGENGRSDDNSTCKKTKSINNKIRRFGKKKLTTYQKQLKILKSSDCKILVKETADDFMHASPRKLLLTYDAYIPVYKINWGSDVDEKRAYIELEFLIRKVSLE